MGSRRRKNDVSFSKAVDKILQNILLDVAQNFLSSTVVAELAQ